MTDVLDPQEQLKQLMAGGRLLSAGKMQVLGMDDVKARFGASWPKVATRVRDLSQYIIEKRLGPNDLSVELGDIGYILVFPDLSRGEAQVKSLNIAKEIAMKLFGVGAGDSDNVSIRTVVGQVDGTVVMEHVDLTKALSGTLEDTGHEYFVDVDGGVQDNGSLKVVDFSEVESGQLDFLSFRYRPIWDVKREAIITYNCVPRDGGESMAAKGLSAENLLKLDIMCLQECCKQLMRLHKKGRKLILSCPIHFDTLSTSKAMQEFMRHCRPIPEQFRQSIIFETIGLPLGVPQARLALVLPPLKAFSREVICKVDIQEDSIGKYTSTGVQALGVDLEGHFGSEESIMELLNKFSQKCEARGLACYVSNVASTSLATSVFSAGFRYVSGDAIRETCAAPDQAFAFEPLNLYNPRKLTV